MEDRVGGQRQNQERSTRCDGSGHDATTGSRHGLKESGFKIEPPSALLSQAKCQMDGEVDSQAEDHDTEDGFHQGEPSGEYGDGAQGNGHALQHGQGDAAQYPDATVDQTEEPDHQ